MWGSSWRASGTRWMAEAVSIEEELERYGRCFRRTSGTSMEPLLHAHSSTVVLEPLAGPPKKGDVVLYRRPDGAYVLHRVLRSGPEKSLLRGDNCLEGEIVPNRWMTGVMTGFYSGEDYCSCDSAAYRRYVRVLPLRYGVRRCRTFLGRVKRKLFS